MQATISLEKPLDHCNLGENLVFYEDFKKNQSAPQILDSSDFVYLSSLELFDLSFRTIW